MEGIARVRRSAQGGTHFHPSNDHDDRRDRMRSTRQLSNRSMLMPGLCVLVGSLFTSGVGMSSVYAAPPSNPNPTHSWDKKLPSVSRFTVLSDFGGAAVRDEETGLVWEKTLE